MNKENFISVISTNNFKNFIKEELELNENEFEKLLSMYMKIKDFKINEHYNDKNNINIDNKLHLFIRKTTEYFMNMVFMAMKIDLNDPNVKKDIDSGNIGTPGRIAKMWTGKDIYDDKEPFSGRFMKSPKITVFPCNRKNKQPIIIKLFLNSNCSHHMVRFGNEVRNNDSYCVISYIPNKYELGLSKIPRWINYISRRGWMQEELTDKIGTEIVKLANTDDVLVILKNMQHGCVSFRGYNDTSSYTTTIFKSGKFNDNKFLNNLLKTII